MVDFKTNSATANYTTSMVIFKENNYKRTGMTYTDSPKTMYN